MGVVGGRSAGGKGDCDFSRHTSRRGADVVVDLELLKPILYEAFSLLGWLGEGTRVVYPTVASDLVGAGGGGGDVGGKEGGVLRGAGRFVEVGR